MEATSEVTTRALTAYFREAKRGGYEAHQPDGATEVKYSGREYVVLWDVMGTLAVYRVQNSGQLRRMRRWPAAVATTERADQ